LHQSLAPGSLENVVKMLVDVTNNFLVKDPFEESLTDSIQQPRATPRQLCDELLKHLRERQLIRNSMRKNEHPWYPIPPDDIIAEVLKRLQALDITDQTEDQLLLLTPQLESLSSLASDPRSSGAFLSSSSGGTNNRMAPTATAFRVRVESKNSGQVDLPGLRLFPLPSKPSIGVRMMKFQPFSSPGNCL
uniref:CARD domain-containing protein n=1 Tax=Rodentolepis nana TaxID=102285 RepID=A0A0R3TI96_RODNA